MISQALADTLLASGSVIGLATKLYALKDENTTWSRTSSGLNIATYPFTALTPFAALGLWNTFTVSLLNFAVWTGIYIWRAPEDENWIGQTPDTEAKTTFKEELKNKIPFL